MPDNFVQKFTLDGDEIKVKDPQASADITQLNTDLGVLQGRVTALEGLSRLSVAYNASTETIAFTTGTHQ